MKGFIHYDIVTNFDWFDKEYTIPCRINYEVTGGELYIYDYEIIGHDGKLPRIREYIDYKIDDLTFLGAFHDLIGNDISWQGVDG